MQDKDTDGVSHHIDQIRQERYLHCYGGLSHGTVDGCAGVVYCIGREGQGHDPHVGLAGVHGQRFRGGVHALQQSGTEQEHEHHAEQRHDPGQMEDLRSGQTASAAFSASDILGDHHGSAGGDGCKQIDKNGIDHGVQANAGNHGLSGIADHHGIRKADDHLQQLLYHQRNDHSLQHIIGKNLLLFTDLLPGLYDALNEMHPYPSRQSL